MKNHFKHDCADCKLVYVNHAPKKDVYICLKENKIHSRYADYDSGYITTESYDLSTYFNLMNFYDMNLFTYKGNNETLGGESDSF